MEWIFQISSSGPLLHHAAVTVSLYPPSSPFLGESLTLRRCAPFILKLSMSLSGAPKQKGLSRLARYHRAPLVFKKRAVAQYQFLGGSVPIWMPAAPQQVKQFVNTTSRVVVPKAHNKNKRLKTLVGTHLETVALAMGA